MIITWIDKKSTLLHGKKTYKAGDVIPAGLLSPERVETLVKDKKIRVGEIAVDKSVKTVSLFGEPVQAKILGETTEEPKKQASKGRPKAGPKVKPEDEPIIFGDDVVITDDDEDEERD